jgi:hypothetical protein
VKKLTELEHASEVFLDTLFSELYDEALELLKRNVRVYLLKDTTALKKLRVENNLKKTDENYAILLSWIPREKFRPLMVRSWSLRCR